MVVLPPFEGAPPRSGGDMMELGEGYPLGTQVRRTVHDPKVAMNAI
jgi:hypothetical protein